MTEINREIRDKARASICLADLSENETENLNYDSWRLIPGVPLHHDEEKSNIKILFHECSFPGNYKAE